MSPRCSSWPCSDTACTACRRRSWLLEDLSALLDYHRGDPARLTDLLGLGGKQLIPALAGTRREALARAYDELEPAAVTGPGGTVGLCAHARSWPARLGGSERMLWLTSPAARFVRLSSAPSLTIVGSEASSPYGAETAASLARGLAAAGVTIVAGLNSELTQAAHRGAAEGRGGSLAVAGDGLERIRPSGAARTAREVARRGCVLSELPARASGRGWGSVAAERTAVELGSVAVLVEGLAEGKATAIARVAIERGVTVGVVPGPVTSRLSTGPHALLMEGANLVRDAADALELLYADCPGKRAAAPCEPSGPALDRRLSEILERVGSGEDTAERLSRGPLDAGAVVAALGELEAIGLLRRLSGGRYVATQPARRVPGVG